MKYRVIEFFTDAQDNKYAYNVGDEFPHKGATVSPERIAELSSTKNKRQKPLIEPVEEKKVSEDYTFGEIEKPRRKKRS